MKGFALRDVAETIAALSESGLVLIGGQALNYWADHYLPDTNVAPPTSKDLDMQGDKRAVEAAASTLGVAPRWSTREMDTVNSGLIEVTTAEGELLEINVLHSVFGLKSEDVARTAIPVAIGGAWIRVLHPVLVMESRFANISGLHRTNEHALSQARTSVECVRAMLRERAPDNPREALDLITRIFRYSRSNMHARCVYRDHDIDAFAAVEPLEALPESFRTEDYPRKLAELNHKRRSTR